jgi:hypothetical protein
MPGRYTVALSKRIDGVMTTLSKPQRFSVIVEGTSDMSDADRAALVEFQQKVSRLQRAVTGALENATSARTRIGLMKRAIQETPAADPKLAQDAIAIDRRLGEMLRVLRGDSVLRSLNENSPPSINERVSGIVREQRMSTARPTGTQVEQYNAAAKDFEQVLTSLRALIEGDLARLEKALEAAGAPHTPGRLPEWKDN